MADNNLPYLLGVTYMGERVMHHVSTAHDSFPALVVVKNRHTPFELVLTPNVADLEVQGNRHRYSLVNYADQPLEVDQAGLQALVGVARDLPNGGKSVAVELRLQNLSGPQRVPYAVLFWYESDGKPISSSVLTEPLWVVSKLTPTMKNSDALDRKRPRFPAMKGVKKEKEEEKSFSPEKEQENITGRLERKMDKLLQALGADDDEEPIGESPKKRRRLNERVDPEGAFLSAFQQFGSDQQSRLSNFEQFARSNPATFEELSQIIVALQGLEVAAPPCPPVANAANIDPSTDMFSSFGELDMDAMILS